MHRARCLAALFVLMLTGALMMAGAGRLAADPLRLVLDGAFAPHHVPILTALEAGHFRRAGIEAVIEPGLGPNMVAVLVGQRAFDIGHLTASTAASAVSRGTPIRMVAIYQPRTALAIVGLKGRVLLEGAKSVEKLRLGITPGTADSMAFTLFRRAQSIVPSAVTVIPVDRGAKLEELLAGRLDLVLGDAAILRAGVLAQGETPEVLELADFGVPLQGFGFVANQALLGNDSGLVRRALAAIRAGFADAAADPLAACRAARARHALVESDEACEAALVIFLGHVTPASAAGWGRQSGEAWQRMIEAMRASGEIHGTRPPSFYFTNSVAP